MRASKRSVAGVPAHQMRINELREELEWQRQLTIIAALMPYAAKKLPPEILRCFDGNQKRIRLLPTDILKDSMAYRRRQIMRGDPKEFPLQREIRHRRSLPKHDDPEVSATAKTQPMAPVAKVPEQRKPPRAERVPPPRIPHSQRNLTPGWPKEATP